MSVPALRLGFPVKVLGKPGLKSNDTRRWQQSPHLRVSLAYVRDIFAYLEERDISICGSHFTLRKTSSSTARMQS